MGGARQKMKTITNKKIERLIIKKLGVKSKNELVGYTSPREFGIYKKSDVYIIHPKSYTSYVREGYMWDVRGHNYIQISEYLTYWADLSEEILRELNIHENRSLYFTLWNFAEQLQKTTVFLKI